MGQVCHVVCMFTFRLLLVLVIMPTHGRMARLSCIGWLVTYEVADPPADGYPSRYYLGPV